MADDWYITDGTVTVYLSPGANDKAMIDKTAGLFIIPYGRSSTPKPKSLKRTREVLIVQTTFKSRAVGNDYATLRTMVKEEGNAENGAFTFVQGSDSYNVAVRHVIKSSDAGEGDLKNIEIEMEVVQ